MLKEYLLNFMDDELEYLAAIYSSELRVERVSNSAVCELNGFSSPRCNLFNTCGAGSRRRLRELFVVDSVALRCAHCEIALKFLVP
jgi:hypothetical protein